VAVLISMNFCVQENDDIDLAICYYLVAIQFCFLLFFICVFLSFLSVISAVSFFECWM
jgi:hypothetical protein